MKSFYIISSKTSANVKLYEGQTRWIYFLILDYFNYISDKVSADIKNEFDNKPVYDKTFLKTKIKSYGGEVTYFYDEKIPKVEFNLTFLAVISLELALKEDEKYNLEVFLKEYKYIEKM